MDDHLPDLARRVGQACRLTGTFTLRSGQVSTTYFDKYLFEADPVLLGAVARSATFGNTARMRCETVVTQ